MDGPPPPGTQSLEFLLQQQQLHHRTGLSNGNNPLVSESIHSRTRAVRSRTKKQQIENYRNGKGLLLNLHATHHGGTTFCDIVGRTGGPVAELTNYTTMTKANVLATTPWRHNETDTFVRGLRPYFHMISWEYRGVDDLKRNVSETNWEHPNLVSVVIVRHPMSRILAGDRTFLQSFSGYNTGTLSQAGWWDIAADPERRHADNFFFRILEGTPRPGTETNPFTPLTSGSERQLNAVAMLDRFTFVLDIACLHDGIRVLATLLGLDLTRVRDELVRIDNLRISRGKTQNKLSVEEKIGHRDVYEYLLQKNEWDIRLYEYAKTVSLVRCES
eukprot:jgi/Psemu1/193421/e_gw1.142.71.1